MEEFRNIDWHPPLEDILDHVFIHEERMKKESAMYRIMCGTFVDPFENVDDIEDGEVKEEEREEDNEVKRNPIKMNKQSNSTNKKEGTTIKRKQYVPGIVKSAFNFPRTSQLTKEQHSLCLRVMLRFSGSEKPEMTQSDRDELETYMKLVPLIHKEQDEFLEFAKKKWDGTELKMLCEDYINLRWKKKMQNITELPRYYTEAGNIAFVADKEIGIKFETTLLEMGTIPRVILPTFIRPYILSTDSVKLQHNFIHEDNIVLNSSVTSKIPVSQDLNCKRLVKDTGADLVISSSGLNCLVNNIGPNYRSCWSLPVLIKQENGKNVIYIDKSLPSTAKTIPEKNDWVYKYILRSHLVHFRHFTSIRLPKVNEGNCNYENVVNNVHSDEDSSLERKEDNLPSCDERKVNTSLDSIDKVIHLDKQSVVEENENKNSTKPCTDPMDDDVHKPYNLTNEMKTDCLDPFVNCNVSYRLFSIGSSVAKNELMKNIVKDYKILVRSKIDGFEKLPHGVIQLVMLAPKLEYQVALGAEAVTLEEALKQWISLTFRPNTHLLRVRISATTSEVLQIEKRTTASINNEIKRLYKVKVEDSLTLLHNVIDTLMNASPGRYIIRHTVRNGAFATIYKETTRSGRNVFDLHTLYGDEQLYTIPNAPWPALDKVVVTPMLKCFELMPAMFRPSKFNTFPFNNKKNIKKQKLRTAKTKDNERGGKR